MAAVIIEIMLKTRLTTNPSIYSSLPFISDKSKILSSGNDTNTKSTIKTYHNYLVLPVRNLLAAIPQVHGMDFVIEQYDWTVWAPEK